MDIEESLHPWDKAHLVMVYDLFKCWRRLCPSLMGEWRPHFQGVSDVTRVPEMGFSDAELEGVMVSDAHLFLS